MKELIFENEVTVFGIEVKTFPLGIGEAFNELIKATGDCAGERNYYGISSMKDGKMIYKAVAEEKFEGEATQFNYEKDVIENGEYAFEVLINWRDKTSCIKDVFHEMMKDNRIDKTKPAVEWYKSEDEMYCMVKVI